MPETASSFFGMDFGGSKPVVTQATAPAAPAVPNPSEKGVVQSAMEFFGIDFATKDKPKPPVIAPDTTTQGDWSQIDNKYRAGQSGRNKDQLTLLQGELAQERDPSRIEILKREIARAQKLTGNTNG